MYAKETVYDGPVKACPFCGGTDIHVERVYYYLREGVKSVNLVCASCGAKGPNGKDDQEASARWMLRAGEKKTIRRRTVKKTAQNKKGV